MAGRLMLNSVRSKARSSLGFSIQKPSRVLIRTNTTAQATTKQSSDVPWAIGGLALLGAGFYYLMSPPTSAHAEHKPHSTTEGSITDKVEKGLEAAKDTVESKVSSIKGNKNEILSELSNKGKEYTDAAYEQLDKAKKGVADTKKEYVDAAYDKLDQAKKGAADVKKEYTDAAYDKMEKAKSEALQSGQKTIESTREKVTELANKSTGSVEEAKRGASELVKSAEDLISKNVPTSTINSISGQVTDTINVAVDKAEQIIDQVAQALPGQSNNTESLKDQVTKTAETAQKEAGKIIDKVKESTKSN